ncbi:MAG: hypothetical protein C5S48_02395 [Candidatus Methanogaster sp.]|nr:MAG: hypothetical protein C5S48_02395 [ANME-2 cluster archaeon]
MYQLKLTPKTENGKNELTGTMYWYPLNVSEKRLKSVNIATRSTYEQLKERWTRGGRVVLSSPIDGTYGYFLYFGTTGDPRILPMFGERPLMVKNQCILYFFTDNDINSIYNEINTIENKPHATGVKIPKKLKACLDFFGRYLSSGWDVSLEYISSKYVDSKEEYAFCTNSIGLHPLLHLIRLIPDSAWNKEYYKQILIFLFKNGFLVSWMDIDDFKSANKREYILQECEKISGGEITIIPQFKDVSKDIIKQLIDKYEFFGILHLASQSVSKSSVFRELFNNLFELVPREQKEWVGYPRFQPKMVIDELEMHFIQRAGSPAKIHKMADALKKIFDKIDFYGLRDRRHRFICDVALPARDYSLLPDRVGAIYDAVRTIARENHLSEPAKEMWVKRIAVRFITPPQFEDDVLLAFSKNWFFRRRPREFDELDEKNRRKILKADIICDYSVYQDGEFIFPFKYSQDVQNSYVTLNKLLFKNHNFTQFGEMDPPKE